VKTINMYISFSSFVFIFLSSLFFVFWALLVLLFFFKKLSFGFFCFSFLNPSLYFWFCCFFLMPHCLLGLLSFSYTLLSFGFVVCFCISHFLLNLLFFVIHFGLLVLLFLSYTPWKTHAIFFMENLPNIRFSKED